MAVILPVAPPHSARLQPGNAGGVRRPAQCGVSLLEVLVAIVILSLGLLGITGLQVTGLKNSHSAYLRSQAAQYAYDMIDRMRVNKDAAIGGSYNLVLGDPAPTCGTLLATCDKAEWLGQVAGLPEGDGAINVINGKATVTVQWSEAALGGGTGTFAVDSEL